MKTSITKIKVTQEHIQKGIPNHKCRCPIAIAIAEQTGGCVAVNVDRVYLLFTPLQPERKLLDKWPGQWINFPVKVKNFIRKFDEGLEVSPIEFDLRYATL